ncbi:hypothetical protein [Pseudogemmobacter bohemicus]|uniref:hypothetical protein n=1 Tax=Pseudogemmobacter bohemicus TaxID=2250708 RepID=UPI000DD3737E|nr:hypothetical protein [Pseudogemmobacter bohemicus]
MAAIEEHGHAHGPVGQNAADHGHQTAEIVVAAETISPILSHRRPHGLRAATRPRASRGMASGNLRDLLLSEPGLMA